MGNFYAKTFVETAPVGNQWSSYPDTQVSEKYL